MGGGLIILGACEEYVGLPIAKEILSVYVNDESHENTFKIQRWSDKFTFKHIVFTITDNDFDKSSIYEKIKHGTFTLMIGCTLICTFTYSFLMNLSEVKIINNELIISIPSYFIKEINLSLLKYNEVTVISKTGDMCIINNKLIIELVYVDYHQVNQEKLKSMSLSHYQRTTEYALKPDSPILKIPIQLFDDIFNNIKGFFIGYDITKVKKFAITVDDHYLFDPYDNTTLQLISQKINDKLFYVALNNDHCYSNSDICSYTGSLNSEAFNNITVLIQLHEDLNDELTINVLELGIFAIKNGQCGIINCSQINCKRRLHPGWKTVFVHETVEYICQITKNKSNKPYSKCTQCDSMFEYDNIIKLLLTGLKCPVCKERWVNNVRYSSRHI